jgi:hypothetical protein
MPTPAAARPPAAAHPALLAGCPRPVHPARHNHPRQESRYVDHFSIACTAATSYHAVPDAASRVPRQTSSPPLRPAPPGRPPGTPPPPQLPAAPRATTPGPPAWPPPRHTPPAPREPLPRAAPPPPARRARAAGAAARRRRAAPHSEPAGAHTGGFCGAWHHEACRTRRPARVPYLTTTRSWLRQRAHNP